MLNRAATFRGAFSLQEEERGGVGRTWAGTDTCTVSAGNSAGEHLPVEGADVYGFVSVCHSVGFGRLVERLCGTSWVGAFQSLLQSKLMKRLCCCCPAFSAASLAGGAVSSSGPARRVCAHASQRWERRRGAEAPVCACRLPRALRCFSRAREQLRRFTEETEESCSAFQSAVGSSLVRRKGKSPLKRSSGTTLAGTDQMLLERTKTRGSGTEQACNCGRL